MSGTSSLSFATSEIESEAAKLITQREDLEPSRDLDAFLVQFCEDANMDDFAAFNAADSARLAVDLFAFGMEAALEPLPRRRVRVRDCIGADDRKFPRCLIEAVGPDTPFLVDSAIAAILASGAEIRAVVHPVIHRDDGDISTIQIHTEHLDAGQRRKLKEALEAAFADVSLATADFLAMRQAMKDAAVRVSTTPVAKGRTASDVEEAEEFLNWLVRDHFIFLGARDYRYARGADGSFLAEEPDVVEGSGLGVLRDPHRHVLSRGSEPALLTPQIKAFLDEAPPIIVSKTNMRSLVHRRVYADYIGVKRYDDSGNVIGETRFVGLFTSDAYTRMARDVPLIRSKVEIVKARLEANGADYSARALNNVLETYPRDELFQIEPAELEKIASGVLGLMQRPRTRIFVRRDRFDRFVSMLLYTPRDNYTPELRKRVHTLLAEAFDGRESAFYPSFNDGPLARVHYIVGLTPGHPEPDIDALDIEIRQMAESWEDALARAARLAGTPREDLGQIRFNAAFKEAFTPDQALKDLAAIDAMQKSHEISVRVRDLPGDSVDAACKIYHHDQPLYLSDIVPVLECMGLRVKAETSYPITFRQDDKTVWVHDITLEQPAGSSPLGSQFSECFEAVWNGYTESDGFNSLVVRQGLSWRQAALMRTLCRYRQQTGLDPSEATQIAALANHSGLASSLLKLFDQRLNPDEGGGLDERRNAQKELIADIRKSLNDVASLDEDRVLRRLMHLIRAIQRTNFYQLAPSTGQPYPYISVKIASGEINDLPSPKPFREIFVWSPMVEGVHLRFGPVARGGLRWSDRRDDFRTEVLGLVKAQNVKNAVIVPVGAKGGFYPKNLPENGSREEIRDAGIAAYKTFISALLEISDNLIDGDATHPDRVIAWDGDDPYLVVAADKGTATFSDIANGLSQDHGWWLGDAFASGGSAGYDHKKMGITARGAWEAVKRHFREIGKDIQNEPFTCIGVGDMSGDVFGNGMLLSRHTHLIAAFNHMHIFIDPSPDAEKSYVERIRLFETPRTGWGDYNTKLISKGGGIFERSAKSITLTDEIKAITGLEVDSVTPDELIRALLLSEFELLWFGGIGTYVKAGEETNADVGDKANNALRVNGGELKVSIIGEGANLGVTQKGRIEFARKGGRINTDAIDNSAGVDSSDHEVNIKILLTEAIRQGELPVADRNALLADMTDEVAEHVLRNNYKQTGALSMLEMSAADDLDAYGELMTTLESEGKLARDVEDLPSVETMTALREQGAGLTRPEISVLFAYAKNDLFNGVVEGDAPDQPALQFLLEDYFPSQLRKYDKVRNSHRLKREIIATRIVNRLVNLSGPFFPYQMRDAAAVDISTLAKASETARAVFQIDALMERIEALDNQVPAISQLLMMREIAGTMRQLTGAFIGPVRAGKDLQKIFDTYTSAGKELSGQLDTTLSPFVLERIETRAQAYIEAGAPETLAGDVARLRILATLKETADCAIAEGWPVRPAACVKHALAERLGVDPLRAAARDLGLDGHWERLAQQRVMDAIPGQLASLTAAAMAHATQNGVSPDAIDREAAREVVDDWLNACGGDVDRVAQSAANFEASGTWTLAKLVLVSDGLREFVQNHGKSV
ncbi:MAG: NAD-glutamate dehydrogenase [Hirschia sp.]|nr:NAD-glutamate dehydrogenase [Hirschia sp.]MBF17511.1 NAD-glutamate dehydrogenase [Hirschia sp.]